MNPNQQSEPNIIKPSPPTVVQPLPVATPVAPQIVQPQVAQPLSPQAPVVPVQPVRPVQSVQPVKSDQVGSTMKSLKGWKAITFVLFLIAFFGVFLFFGGFIFIPFVIPGILWYVWIAKRQRTAVKAFATAHGYIYQSKTVLNDLDGVIFQDPAFILGQGDGPSKGYLLNWLVHGQVNARAFRLYEYALESGDNSTGFNGSAGHETGDFDVMDIAVSGEGLQFLLVSNTHRSMLNHMHISLKRYQLEGDFNKYFTLYGADGAEIEILRIFTPDVMAYLIDHYQNYSLELTPQHFFLYRGNASMNQAVANLESMVAAATDLSTKFVSGIEKVHYAQNAVAPASVQTASDQSRIANGFPIWAAILFSIAICAFGSVFIYLVKSDQKIPAGFVQATNAKVYQETTIVCHEYSSSSSACSDLYKVTASFTTQNGQLRYYSDTLPSYHELGSNINLYYNPSHPIEADFVGEHSSSGSIPLVIGFLGVFILFISGAYFSKKKR